MELFKTYYLDDLLVDDFRLVDGVHKYIHECLIEFWNETLASDYSYLTDENLKDSVKEYIISNFRSRELQIPPKFLCRESEDIINEVIVPYIQYCVDCIFKENSSNWQKMYDALIAEYNPIWNVDGEEIRTYVKENTGTQDNVNTKTGNVTDNIEYEGTETVTDTKEGSESEITSDVNKTEGAKTVTLSKEGTIVATKGGSVKETEEKSGSETEKLTKGGSEIENRTGSETTSHYTTAYDVNTPVFTTGDSLVEGQGSPSDTPSGTGMQVMNSFQNRNDTTVTSYGKNGDTADRLMTSKTTDYTVNGNDYYEKTEYDPTGKEYKEITTETYDPQNPLTNTEDINRTTKYGVDENGNTDERIDTSTKSFNGREDNRTTTYNSVKDDATRTDDLKEEYEERLERHGNIGVTKSSDLVDSEVTVRLKYNMTRLIGDTLINGISFMC